MRELTPRLRLTLYAFAALALVAGFLLFAGANRTDDYFSWTIEPPLTAATLGAFYWAAVVLILGAARGGSWAEARPAAYPVALIATLLLAATLIHLDKFDFESLFGWFWLVAYVVVVPGFTLLVMAQVRTPGEDPSGDQFPVAVRVALAVEGVVMIAIGALMFIAPDSAADIWPWTLSPLTSRAMGAFVLGTGLTAALAARDDDRLTFRGPALAYAMVGALTLLAALLHPDDFGDDEVSTTIYLGFAGAVLLTGVYGSIAARASSRS
jgi:uncharacterized membrane protein